MSGVSGVRPGVSFETDATRRTGRAGRTVWLVRARDLRRQMSPRWRDTRDAALRSFVACWAKSPELRSEMIADPPGRGRLTSRLTRRLRRAHRHDAARIAALVHALCDRDGVPAPEWVHARRAPRHICLSPASEELFGPPAANPRSDWRYSDAPAACDWHRVWFDRTFIEEKTVHEL